jgi:hypothetical protein
MKLSNGVVFYFPHKFDFERQEFDLPFGEDSIFVNLLHTVETSTLLRIGAKNLGIASYADFIPDFVVLFDV